MPIESSQRSRRMHQLILDEILTDAVAYSQHDAPASIMDKWSKEQLTFALSSMATRLRLFRESAHRRHHDLCTCEACYLRDHRSASPTSDKP